MVMVMLALFTPFTLPILLIIGIIAIVKKKYTFGIVVILIPIIPLIYLFLNHINPSI